MDSPASPLAAPLVLELRPSPTLLLFLIGIHAGAWACLGAMEWPPGPKWLLGLVVALHLLGSGRRSLLRGPGAVTAVALDARNRWSLRLDSALWVAARLRPGGFVQAWLTVLVLRLESGEARALILLADNCDPAGFRRLRVRLRHARSTPDSG